MLLKHLVFVAYLLATTQGTLQGQTASGGQSASQNIVVAQAAPAGKLPAATGPTQIAQTVGSSAVKPDCQQGPCDYQMPHITVATAAPAPAPWPLQDRILWGANILLALVGYAGIMLAVATLKKIERQTKYGETAALAAQEASEAALIQAKAIVHAERPWILIHVATFRRQLISASRSLRRTVDAVLPGYYRSTDELRIAEAMNRNCRGFPSSRLWIQMFRQFQ